MSGTRGTLIWAALVVAILVPIGAAMASPLLAWRQPIYIAAGFAGIVAMALLLVQPLLIGAVLPGLSRSFSRRLHRWSGAILVAMVTVHVLALWQTSPPDVIDVLLFRSPTPFSVWGVVAMWAVFLAALLAILRHRLRLRPRTWRRVHIALVGPAVGGSVVHAMLIEGTMEPISKAILCALVVTATLTVIVKLRAKPASMSHRP